MTDDTTKGRGERSTWRLSDGTIIELGGKVRGSSAFADELREELNDGASVTIWPNPAPSLPVDPNDVAMMNAWITNAVDVERRCNNSTVTITERPKNIPPLPPCSYKSDGPPGMVYSPPTETNR